MAETTNEETKATYGTTQELKITLKNSEGSNRTLTLANPKTEEEELKAAVDAFAELVLNTETSIISVDGYFPVSVVVDVVETARTNIGTYGQTETTKATIPYLSQSVIELKNDTETNTITVFNPINQIIVTPISDNSASIATYTINQEENTITFTTTSIPEEPIYYIVEFANTSLYHLSIMIN